MFVFSTISLTEVNGGRSFVTDKFFENPEFSFVMIGANKKTNNSKVRTAKEKFNFVFNNRILFLYKIIIKIIIKKITTESIESIKLKVRKENADDESLNSKPNQAAIRE
ncbi:MAG: hypothetical protein HND39_08065 [Ignavibacteriota bacterium]|jgi:hypothetical protein|nr:hypothetical protein [Ignavibacteriales bacterium]MCC7094351.1 hypothetical protein [Ignavibacteriaceae bacterium]QKJ96240.1 MAG: hypothetical protein HND39_08065 [Ignavibacteriota bacterium]MCL4279732.1 hypothetical protein [Ignavibacteriaceae bacterium]MCZ7614677.1 hypothetical protein [Ignavibacteriaceae bacterium]